jgi:hypothetical protein
MSNRLKQLEQQIESLVEGSLSRILGGSMSSADVAVQLAQAMEDGVKWDDQGRPVAPDQFALSLYPESAELLLDRAPDLQAEFAQGLLRIARDCGYQLPREPHITLAADPTLPRRQVRVIAWHSSTPLEFTQAVPRESKSQPGRVPLGAFLIIDGTRHFPLDRAVINIGRRLDNQLILENPHVSRTHAQLRVRDGRFVLFDLGSTAGTRVNGRPIKQHILQPGDVVAMANVRMVYGEDPGGPPDTTPAYTPPFPPRPAGDQRTRTKDWEDNPSE